ncbi:MAG: DUF3784 domain-containing protein [Ruthenibacterium sp.]
MKSWEIVTGCITGAMALALAVYVSFTLRGKGPILSNTYLWLSREQKEKADKKAEYRLVSAVFGGLCGAFAFLTLHIFTGAVWTMILFWIFTVCTIIYALADSLRTILKK